MIPCIVEINFNYINVPEDGIKKLEKSRDFLCKALESPEYVELFSGFKECFEFQYRMDGIKVNVTIGDAIHDLPMKYTKKTSTVTITDWALKRYDIKKLAGYIAHEISHEWYTHGGGDYGSFSVRLIDLIPQIDVNPGLMKRIWNWIKNLFT